MKGSKGPIIPVSILEKQPTAELRPNQTDQDNYLHMRYWIQYLNAL